jgi:hypothetical protein
MSERIWASRHCIDRYREYRHDSDDRNEVLKALLRRFRSGRIVGPDELPDWVNAKRPNEYYLLAGSSLVFPLAKNEDERGGYVAITCLDQRGAERRRARQELITW